MFDSALSSFSVNDLDTAEAFYTNVMGIHIHKNSMGILELNINNDYKVLIYPKPDHKAATFTVLNFTVKNIEKTVDELISRGVNFEQYEGRMKTDEKGIFHGQGPKIAWFKDPAGNILSVLEKG